MEKIRVITLCLLLISLWISPVFAKTLDLSEFQFKFQVPADWQEHNVEGNVIQLTKQFPPTLFQIFYQKSTFEKVTQEVLENAGKDFKEMFSDVKTYSDKLEDWHELSSGWLRVEGKFIPLENADCTLLSYVLINGPWTYIITIAAPTTDWSDTEKSLAMLMKNLEFIK